MKKLSEIQAILVMLIVIGVYTVCVWHSALHFYSIKMEIEASEWKQRHTECHWQLLDSQARNTKLRERLKLK